MERWNDGTVGIAGLSNLFIKSKNPPPPSVPSWVTRVKLYTLLFRVEDVSVQVDLNTLILMSEGFPPTSRDDDRGLPAL